MKTPYFGWLAALALTATIAHAEDQITEVITGAAELPLAASVGTEDGTEAGDQGTTPANSEAAVASDAQSSAASATIQSSETDDPAAEFVDQLANLQMRSSQTVRSATAYGPDNNRPTHPVEVYEYVHNMALGVSAFYDDGPRNPNNSEMGL